MRKPLLPLAAGILLLAAPAFAQQQAGVSAGVHGSVQIDKASYAPAQRPLNVQVKSADAVYMGDELVTGANGGLQVLFQDETTLTLGQNAKLTVDELIYDPVTRQGSMKLNVAQGAFRYVSGQMAHDNPDKVALTLPGVTIGIRGTIVGGGVFGNQTLVALLGPGPGNDSGERHGFVDVTAGGATVRITRPGFATTITPGQRPAPAIRLSPAQIAFLQQATSGGGAAGAQAQPGGSQGMTSASAVSGEGQATGGAYAQLALNQSALARDTNLATNVALGQQRIDAKSDDDRSEVSGDGLNSGSITAPLGAATQYTMMYAATGNAIGYDQRQVTLTQNQTTGTLDQYHAVQPTNEAPTRNGMATAELFGDAVMTLGRWNGGQMGGQFGSANPLPSFASNEGFAYVVGVPTPIATLQGMAPGSAIYTAVASTSPVWSDGSGDPGGLASATMTANFNGSTLPTLTASVTINMPEGTLGQNTSYTAIAGLTGSGNLFGGSSAVTPTGVTHAACTGTCTGFMEGAFFGSSAQDFGLSYSIGNTAKKITGVVGLTH